MKTLKDYTLKQFAALSFAEKIKWIRGKSGLSQAKFAGTLNMKKATLQDWEHGRRSPAGHDVDVTIAQAASALCAIPAQNKMGVIGVKDLTEYPIGLCFYSLFTPDVLQQYHEKKVSEDLFSIMKCSSCVKNVSMSEDGKECVMLIGQFTGDTGDIDWKGCRIHLYIDKGSEE